MEKILVTGADGLLGSAFRALAPPNAVYITRKDADLTDFNQTRDLFQSIQPTRVVHFAAAVGGIGGNMIHSGEYFRNNIMINTNVLESARLSGAKKVISFMSTCVFPDKCQYPLNEKDLHNGPPHPSNFGYAYAKRMLEVQSSAYRKEWGCDYMVAIPANIYGPHDNWSLTEGHVIPALIHKCFLAKKNKTEIYVWGSGTPLREFIYSEDIAKLALWALDEYKEDAPIIFSSGIETSIKELVHMVCDLIDFKGEIKFDSTKPDGQYRKPSDTAKLKKYLPEFKFKPMDEGLKKTISWFVENYPNLRN